MNTDFKSNFDKEFDEKFEVLEKGNPDGSFTLEVGDRLETSNERCKSFFHSYIEKQETKLLCEFQDAEMKWKRQLEEAKQEQIEECLEIINHSINKDDAYKEVNQKLKKKKNEEKINNS